MPTTEMPLDTNVELAARAASSQSSITLRRETAFSLYPRSTTWRNVAIFIV